MTDIQTVVLIGHTIIALLIIILVLLQRGKGADAGAAFGAGASGTVFGARGSSNFFSRATAVMATVFFASSLALAYLSSQRSGSVDSLLEDSTAIEQVDEQGASSSDETDLTDVLPEFDESGPESADEDAEQMPDLEPPPEDTSGEGRE